MGVVSAEDPLFEVAPIESVSVRPLIVCCRLRKLKDKKGGKESWFGFETKSKREKVTISIQQIFYVNRPNKVQHILKGSFSHTDLHHVAKQMLQFY